MKKNKLIMIITILILVLIIVVLLLNYVFNNKNSDNKILDYKVLNYENISGENYHESLFDYMNIDDNYVIIDSYSDYENFYNKIVNSNYEIKIDNSFDESYFLDNSLVIINDYMDSIVKYSADVKSMTYKNNTLDITLCVDYYSSSVAGGSGSLTFIEVNDKNIKKVDIDVETHNTRTNFEVSDKPVIYLYPEEETELSVILGKPELITCIYPEYQHSWNIIAKPDGTIIDKKTKEMYYSLYYESINAKDYSDEDMTEGFVVSRDNLVKFLEDKLQLLGLNYKEKEEFIIYWLPKLQEYKYIYIRFQTMKEIEENMPLIISKEPDTLIRIMMEWKGLENKINVKEQELNLATRKGFTVVEWGGTEIK